jgi:hypothetical protein
MVMAGATKKVMILIPFSAKEKGVFCLLLLVVPGFFNYLFFAKC